LTRWQRAGLVGLLLFFVVFGAIVEKRSAFSQRRMTDLGVYLRAAWAVRSDGDLYAVTDNNGWHYHYPPLFAILLVPLADPPPGVDAWALPFAVSVALWHIACVVALALAVHWLATALEEASADPSVRAQPRFCRRWWALRAWPVLACLMPIGQTLARGQVNLFLLALLCAALAASVRGRPWRAGLWLSGAICLKLLPVFLLLYPLWRREWRALAGCALGLVIGMGFIPMLAFGPEKTVAYYRQWDQQVLRPGMGGGEDHSRARELTNITGTDSQSLLTTLHNTLHLERTTRPVEASAVVRFTALGVGALMLLLTFLSALGRRGSAAQVILGGQLIVLMILISPVCHIHYFCLAIPLVMGLCWTAWERRGYPHIGTGLASLLVVNAVCGTIPSIPGLEVLRDLGLGMYPVIGLWLAGCVALWRHHQRQLSHQGEERYALAA
jgi:hypothetical protein